jgi:hypothetical protein
MTLLWLPARNNTGENKGKSPDFSGADGISKYAGRTIEGVRGPVRPLLWELRFRRRIRGGVGPRLSYRSTETMTEHRLEVADVFRSHESGFFARWGHVLSPHQSKTFRAIRDCRTAES